MEKTTKPSVFQWSQRLLYGALAMLLMLGTQECIPQDTVDPFAAEIAWADSVYSVMSEDERLGQLFSIEVRPPKGAAHLAEVERLIEEFHVGGMTFFQGTPEQHIELVNKYQALSKRVPIMIAIDAEYGLYMRLKESVVKMPYQMTLGALQDNRLIYDLGATVAAQLKRVGYHVNFAPVVDVNNNGDNPVINFRSFGENREAVVAKAFQYIKGMEDNGILACAKHFPGHGDTDVDSHIGLPVVPHDMERLDSIELFPFRVLAQKGVGSMMIAHMHVPAIDDRENRPTSLSRKAITGILKEEIGYDGLIFSDALDMGAVVKNFPNGEIAAEALLAGNDVLTLAVDLEAAFAKIKAYLRDGRLSSEQVERSVKKVLRYKYRLGLAEKPKPMPIENVRADINNEKTIALNRQIYAEALTLVRNEADMLPFGKLNLDMASLSIGRNRKTKFQERLNSYKEMEHFYSGKTLSSSVFNKLKDKDVVIVSLHDINLYPGSSGSYGITQSTRDFIGNLSKETKVVLVVFGNPYTLKYFDYVDWVLEAYEENAMTEDLAAQALFGGIPIKGKLPITASNRSRSGDGVIIEKASRFGYVSPREVGLDSGMLTKIDYLAAEAIDAKATPGCVVFVAKDGKVVYEKAYGTHTYDKEQPVQPEDIYDLASVTKVAATTLAIMKLHDQGKIDINRTLGYYLPEVQGTNKAGLTIRDIMTHRARLLSWIPFYTKTIVKRSRRRAYPSSRYYRKSSDNRYSVPVTQKLYMRADHIDDMWAELIETRLRSKDGYRYSDLGFYLLSKLVHEVSGQPLDEFMAKEFYEPMGLETMMYNPWKKFPLDRMPPTEEDRYFRNQQVRGYVHDMGAAMMGGVSGHAGLFSSARDLGVLMQMLNQSGNYGNVQYLDSTTVRMFTKREPMSTRTGIGFDLFKTNPNMRRGMPQEASNQTYGHIGFTGTCAWVDPENELVYVFLSNRTYPSMNNYKINRLGLRSSAFGAVYDAMLEDHKREKSEIFATEELPTKPLPKSVSSDGGISAAERIN